MKASLLAGCDLAHPASLGTARRARPPGRSVSEEEFGDGIVSAIDFDMSAQ